MATLNLQTTELRLSKTEQAMLERSLRDFVSRSSKQRTKELNETYQRRRRFRELLEAELRKVDFDVEKLRRFANQEYARLDKAFAARAKRGGQGRAGTSRAGRPDAVWGLTSGSAKPPHDFSWADHDVIGAPAAGHFRHIADEKSGDLEVYAHAHDSSPEMVDSLAVVGFWYIPNRMGDLSVSIAPPLHIDNWCFTIWNDVAATGGWIGLMIERYRRKPFRFVDQRSFNIHRLWWTACTSSFGEVQSMHNYPAHSMSVSAFVDTSHYYACSAWIEAYAWGKNGGSYAGAHLTAPVRSFTYKFV
jgi:hypothetical protein